MPSGADRGVETWESPMVGGYRLWRPDPIKYTDTSWPSNFAPGQGIWKNFYTGLLGAMCDYAQGDDVSMVFMVTELENTWVPPLGIMEK